MLRRRLYMIESSGYEVKEIGDSPLTYNHVYPVKRIVLCDKSVDTPPQKNDTYFSRIERWRRFSKRGGMLKKPVLDEIIPGVDENCIVAFLDYHKLSEGHLKIDYVKTRGDLRGKKYMSALIDWFYKKNSGATNISWGKLMREEMGHLLDKMKKRYPEISSSGGRNY